MKKTPIIKKIEIIPIAGQDSMLLNLSGAHAPFFSRNIILIYDNSGNLGVGEVPGGEKIRFSLENSKNILLNQSIGQFKNILSQIKSNFVENENRGNQTFDLRVGVHVLTAIESALLDLLGQFLNISVASLLGDGIQRTKIPVLGYLFYIGQSDNTFYEKPVDENSEDWFNIRNISAINSEGILRQAKSVQAKYGFKDFKLKGGVFSGQKEVETIKLLKQNFPEARITLDPNGAWLLKDAIQLMQGMNEILAYAEDPCGAEDSYSGREVLAEFKKSTGIRTATNMIATDFRQLSHSLALNSVDIPLADPHFWTLSGSVRVGQICQDWNLTWGSHSNNHFDISLAMFTQVAASIPGKITAIDTHWIWQDGQNLTQNPLKIENGEINLPKESGLGIKIDFGKLEQAHNLYLKHKKKLQIRNDSEFMQALIPNWQFNPKCPAMIR